MLPSQTEFEALIQQLQSQKTEPAEIDAKEDLPLAKDGDKAFFIHHVAALANNVTPSYLIIGIEDKSWTVKGLRPDSPLINPDQTQNQMNQVIGKRLDPQLSVRYCTYDYGGKTIGVVAVEGVRAPYLVAIDDDRYGGSRTKGEPCFISRGVTYVRLGDSTIIANRQSRVLEILKLSSESSINAPDEFLVKNNYVDVDAQDYGHNDLSNKLVEITRSTRPEVIYDTRVASSWVSFVFSPLDRNCKIDTTALIAKLQPDKRIGRDGQWYHGLPQPILEMLFYAKGTPKTYSGRGFPGKHESSTEYTHAFDILVDGHIQAITTYPLFLEHKEIRFYKFVNLIGYLWQLTYLVRAIYRDAGYHGDTLLLLNLIGSYQTFLDGFAKGPTKKWYSTIFDWEYTRSSQDQVQEKSIRIERQINLVDASDGDIEYLIRTIAEELGKYYGQQTPKCFTPDTNEFPVNKYVSDNR